MCQGGVKTLLSRAAWIALRTTRCLSTYQAWPLVKFLKFEYETSLDRARSGCGDGDLVWFDFVRFSPDKLYMSVRGYITITDKEKIPNTDNVLKRFVYRCIPKCNVCLLFIMESWIRLAPSSNLVRRSPLHHQGQVVAVAFQAARARSKNLQNFAKLQKF